MQILVQFAWNYLRECPKIKFFEFEYFCFRFTFVEMFQFSLNFASSLMFFSAEFSIEFSFSCLTWYNFSNRISFNFTFISWDASCLLKYISAVQEASDKTLLLAIFRAFRIGPRIRTEGPDSSSQQRVGGSFLVLYCLGLLLLFPL